MFVKHPGLARCAAADVSERSAPKCADDSTAESAARPEKASCVAKGCGAVPLFP